MKGTAQRRFRWAILCGLAMAFAIVTGLLAAPVHAQDWRAPHDVAEMQLSFAPVVRETAPAVVNVYSTRVVRSRALSPFSDDPFFRFFDDDPFFSRRRERVQQSLGSGVILRSDGVVVTNNHVVEGALDLRVALNDRREFEAELLVSDERTDLAVLQIDTGGEPLPTLELAETSGLEVGDLVLAIGNPFGAGQSVTNGIVSALGRSAGGASDVSFFIQTDAAINPGNSGGALVNMNGDLVGVNTAIFSRSGGSNGIGFAIPAELVGRVVDSALTEGRIVRAWLGAKGSAVTREVLADLELDRPRGVLIEQVFPSGPADAAGLLAGDVVLQVDGVDVNSDSALQFQLATLEIGERAELDVWRAGRPDRLTLIARAPVEEPARDVRLLDGQHPLQGAEIANLSPAFNEELGIDPLLRGVAVIGVSRGSAASYYGFRPGQILISIEDTPIESTAELEAFLIDRSGMRSWRLVVEQGGQRTRISLRF